MFKYPEAISKRYDSLSKQECCLSCGSALSLADIRKGQVCVDLGCGKGHDVLRMAIMAGSKGFAYGIDISDGMMETARANAEKSGLKNAAFLKCPLEKLSLQSDTADLVLSNCTINHSLDQARVWKEVARILKSGGRFVVSDIYAMEEVPAQYRAEPEAVAECWAGAVEKEVYLANILDAGFRNIEILEESDPYEKGAIRVASFTLRGFKP